MDAHKIFSTTRGSVIATVLAITLAGCNSKPVATDDASLNSQVQGRLSSDQNLSGQPIQASVANSVVTLNGSVSSDAARSAASSDAAQVAGVKTVVNNLVVQPPLPTVAEAPMNQKPLPTPKANKPSAMVAQSAPQPAPVVRNQPAPQPTQQAAPAPVVTQAAPPPPPPPPMPVVHNITLPAGTAIPVRITQTLDSATTQTGDKFTGAIASDIIVDGMVVLPQGTSVTGHVDAAQDAAHFKGSALLTISLTAINRRGEHVEVATEAYTKQGEGRGKNTAEKVGGGAAVGAILGGILGGGRGAAIGAAAGGGVGAGANGVTRGQQVQIPSETVVRFKLTDAIILHVTTAGETQQGSGPTLERHSNE
jgi:outer membrane lipoprotein SlyB